MNETTVDLFFLSQNEAGQEMPNKVPSYKHKPRLTTENEAKHKKNLLKMYGFRMQHAWHSCIAISCGFVDPLTAFDGVLNSARCL